MQDYLKGREMRRVIRNEKSEWREVTSGVPQGPEKHIKKLGTKTNLIFEKIQEKAEEGEMFERQKSTVFPHRNRDTWERLQEEVIEERGVHQLKEKLD